MATAEELKARFGASEHGNFEIVDTIGVPHPYCIGAGHVTHASDRFGGRLDAAAIESAEKQGIYCATCKGKLKWHEHEHALLVECRSDIQDSDGKAVPELHAYLLACKEKLTSDTEYAGFAFLDKREGK